LHKSYVIHKYTVRTKLGRFRDEHGGGCTGQEAWKIEGLQLLLLTVVIDSQRK